MKHFCRQILYFKCHFITQVGSYSHKKYILFTWISCCVKLLSTLCTNIVTGQKKIIQKMHKYRRLKIKLDNIRAYSSIMDSNYNHIVRQFQFVRINVVCASLWSGRLMIHCFFWFFKMKMIIELVAKKHWYLFYVTQSIELLSNF